MSQPAGDDAQVEAALADLQAEYEAAQENFDANPEDEGAHQALMAAEEAFTRARSTARQDKGQTQLAPGGDVIVGTQPEDGGNQ